LVGGKDVLSLLWGVFGGWFECGVPAAVLALVFLFAVGVRPLRMMFWLLQLVQWWVMVS
jgi:hypothetical protein